MEDVTYFKEKLYRSLNIPVSRLLTDSGFNMGRASEITRDEIKFTKFIQRLRKRFCGLFQDLVMTQCTLKGIMTIEDWDIHKENIIYDFNDDNHFFELKDAEILKDRIEQLQGVSEYLGTYFSVEWVRKNVLKQSQQDFEEIDKQIKAEKEEEIIDPEAGTNMGGPDGGFGQMPDGEWQNEPQGVPGQPAPTMPDADDTPRFGQSQNGNL